jgi:hypothetical protein
LTIDYLPVESSYHCRIIRREGVHQNPSQKTCQVYLTIIQSFRVKGMECKSCKAFIFHRAGIVPAQSFPPGSSHKKIFQKNEKENFYCGCCMFQ